MKGTIVNDQTEASVLSISIIKHKLASRMLTIIMRIVTQFPLSCVGGFLVICLALSELCFKSSCYKLMIAIATLCPDDSISTVINTR